MSGLKSRVVNLLLQLLLGELCLRVKEDQLPLPPPPGIWRRPILDMGRMLELNVIFLQLSDVVRYYSLIVGLYYERNGFING